MGRIEFTGIQNARDLGGMIGAEGKPVKERRLIRSGALFGSTSTDLESLQRIGVHTVVDFRTPVERNDAPDPVDGGFSLLQLPLLDDSFFGIARDGYSVMSWLDLFADHSKDPDEVFCEMYRKLLFSERVRPLFRQFFELLLQDRPGAVLWHCSAGKDRAGIAALLVLTALGVSRADAVSDYMLTGVYTAAEIRAVEAEAKARTTDRHMLRAVAALMEVRETYVGQLFDLADRQYGGMLSYLYSAGILSPSETQTLRSIYLES